MPYWEPINLIKTAYKDFMQLDNILASQGTVSYESAYQTPLTMWTPIGL